ncbi:hypothetical protein IW150_007129 [Coemansia sp. RSA 2607]|nr:hypothetical protein IW150_007129 [Coemansia sp. RSA 2607]KAJ2385633.1 hypothetical protein GGI05_004637 [Coemansia sp. RSA 2603]
MTEEMHKVSSWLFHNQDHHAVSPRSWSNAMPQAIAGTGSHHVPSQSQLPSAVGALGSANQQETAFSSYQRPTSESEFSVKRKASHEQLEQPRKSRGNVWSPIRETSAQADQNTLALAAASAEANVSSASAADDNGKARASDATSRRRDEKKALSQRVVLTEDERRANHIASEQRRRNQIRQGYAELMNLVTTLRDPALGNHPGTAQSTPSKAVILSHAVQFIRGLEEGNRLLRKRIEGTPRHLLQPLNSLQQQHQLTMQAQSHAQSGYSSFNACSPNVSTDVAHQHQH